MISLAKCIRENKWPTIITLLTILLEAIIETRIPTITADLVNKVKSIELTGTAQAGGMKEVLIAGLTLFVMAAISLACGGVAGYTSARAAAGFAKNVRHDIYYKIQDFSFSNIDKFSVSSLVTRLTTDITNVQMTYMMLIRMAIRAPLMIVFSAVMAHRMGGRLAASFLIIIPVLGCGLIVIGIFALPAFRRVFKKYDRLNQSVEENVRAMRVVKSFAREDYEKKKFGAASEDIRKDFTFAERVVALNMPIMQLCVNFNLVFILYVGSKIIISNRGATIDVGQLSAMMTYGFQILMSLMMLSIVFVFFTISIESAKRINEVLKEKPNLTNPENPVYEVADGSIDFEDAVFKYSDKAQRNALEKTNLHIPSGATVGVIGGTGVGKSTFVQLIPRLYDVTEGCVKVGGRNVKEYDLVTLRDSVAMVLQKNVIFSGSIRENLRWGDPNASDEETENACRAAQAHDFIMSFLDGYDTHIEQGGTNVSGGQKQRLCIARALLKKPKVLIFDDSTSAVDTRTDALIRKELKEYMPQTTKIIIAQRIASVQDADMILVMDDGRIEAAGTHDQLLESCSIYREVYEQQSKGGEQDE
jgi:ATP-binding cassette subfamily B protein